MGYAYALIYGAAAIAGFSAFAAVVRAYFARVAADGGTTVDKQHAQEIYTDTNPYDPTLIQSCDSGKATVAYSLLVNPQALLETFTGSAAAYSLRSLSAGTTNVVKVRRSGDDAELDFTATEVSDGTLASWVTAGGGTEDGFVTTWYDQSGNGNDATQATAAKQPKIVSSGTLVTENGKAALDFDGSDDELQFSDANLPSGDSNIHSFCVIKSNASGDKHFFSYGTASTKQAFFIGQFSGTNRVGYFNNNFDGGNITGQSLLSVESGNSSIIAYKNNSQIISDTTTGVNITKTGTAYIGDLLTFSLNYNGEIQELIFYPSDQSANRTGIEDNINAHYNIYP